MQVPLFNKTSKVIIQALTITMNFREECPPFSTNQNNNVERNESCCGRDNQVKSKSHPYVCLKEGI